MAEPTPQNFFDASSWVYGYADSNLPPPIPVGLSPFYYQPGTFDSGLLPSGFHGAAFLTSGPDPHIVIAFEGTDNGGYDIRPNFFLAQVEADIALYLGFVPEALTDAASFAKQVVAAATAQGFGTDRIVVTGHSLGAAEAAYVSTQTGLDGTTFAAPGLSTDQVSFGGAGTLTNYVDFGDPIGNYSATPSNIEGAFLFDPAIQRVGDPNYIGDFAGALALAGAGAAFAPGNSDAERAAALATFAALAATKHPLTNYGEDLNLNQNDAPVIDASRIVAGSDYALFYGDLIDRDPLVSDAFYAVRNPDVRKAGIDAEIHYAAFGWHEGRDPNPLFSTTGYLASNPDVARAGLNPLAQYDRSGWKEGRDPSAAFDNELYLARNPDVKAAGVDPLAHYLHFGRYEGRETFEAIGRPGDLSVHPGFDAEFYLLSNPDVARAALAAGGDSFAFAYGHYETFGWHEGRDPNAFFDVKGYLSAYADVKAAGIDPLQHYDLFGWREGRDPSKDFDTRQYESHYADVSAARVDPLLHYLQFGALEGRSTFADGHFA